MSLTINEGEIRGLVGESGSGKSLVAKAICGVTKDNWRVSADRLRLATSICFPCLHASDATWLAKISR